jgi:hypothetical protein
LKIKRVEVLTNLQSVDKVNIYLDGPLPFPRMDDVEACAVVDVQKGLGVVWALEVAQIAVLEINCKTGEKTTHAPVK